MRIAVLTSGGVDSSVVLRLLHRQGHEVHAFYLKIWLEDELAFLGQCPWEDDLHDVRAVCEQIGAPLEVIPLQREYHERVVSWMIGELEAGRTPSPDILCNRLVKFGAFFNELGRFEKRSGTLFDHVASGHYARLEKAGEQMRLLRGTDPVKDQTYFLFFLEQAQLRRCLFPLGGLHKSEVRRLAAELDLPNQARRDSQGICFLGRLPYDDFVRGYLGERPGEIREIAGGKRLGEHRGTWFHTIGQRRGLGLGGGPWFVVDKDHDKGILWVTHGDDLERYQRDVFHVPEVHWIDGVPRQGRFGVRVRHSPAIADVEIEPRAGGGVEVRLDHPDPGLAEGQWAVFYDGEECLGGGMIHFFQLFLPPR